MTSHRALISLIALILVAFGLRALSLDTQSMWRDEIDTLCFALGFWEQLQRAAAPVLRQTASDQIGGSAAKNGLDSANESPEAPVDRPNCQPLVGLNSVDPSKGFWSTLRSLLTLPGWNGPLYTVAMRPWISLTGYTPFALRFNSLLFGLLAVPLSYVLGRRLLGNAVGLLGGALVAVSPHLVWYSQEAKMYGAILALGLLAIYGLRRALESADESFRWWGVTVGATTVAFYCHILAALLVPLHVILSIIWWPYTRRHWRGALIALALLTIPYLPLLTWQLRNWLLPVGRATLFNVQRLDLMLEATFDGWGGGFVAEPWATLILGGVALLALFGLASVWLTEGEPEKRPQMRHSNPSTDNRREPFALLAWMFLPLLGIWLISARQPIFTSRYLIWSAPAFYLLAAVGSVSIARQGRGGALIVAGLLLVVLIGDGRALLHQANQSIKPDFRAAASFLEERYQPGDLIVFHLSYMAYNFDFYYSGEYKGWGAPAPGNEMSQTEVDFHLQTNTSGHSTVWLVLSEPTMWDPRGLIKSWLDTHAVVPAEEQIFAHVSVYKYQLHE